MIRCRRWGPSLSLTMVLAAACNGDGDDGSGGACMIGQQVACTCPDGSASTQPCLASGTLGPCTCSDATGGTQTEGDTQTTDPSGDTTAGGSSGIGVEDPA